MYPGNGTELFESGTQNVTSTFSKINLPYVLPISGFACIFAVIAVYCICAYYRAVEEQKANEPVDIDIGEENSSFRNINDSN